NCGWNGQEEGIETSAPQRRCGLRIRQQHDHSGTATTHQRSRPGNELCLALIVHPVDFGAIERSEGQRLTLRFARPHVADNNGQILAARPGIPLECLQTPAYLCAHAPPSFGPLRASSASIRRSSSSTSTTRASDPSALISVAP